MTSALNISLVFDVIKLTLYIACGYIVFKVYALRTHSAWMLSFTKRNFSLLALLTLLVVGIKLFEDVIAKETGSFDNRVLWLIRQNTSPNLRGFFEVITLSGSAVFLAPTGVALCSLLLFTGRRSESILLAASLLAAWILTYIFKAAIRRPRPEFWDTSWYWGSSFPSGHTLNTASFAIASACIAARVRPKSRGAAFMLAMTWISLMGLSRLVLGVHWPTDVLAAICLGVFIPLAISMILDLNLHRP